MNKVSITPLPAQAPPLPGEAPQFSIIIPVYNTEDYLEGCLRSAMAQTLRDIEIIVIDDGSTDASPAIAARLAEEDHRIRLLRQENGGQGVARNRGLECARGHYVMFLDSDDTLNPQSCEIVARAFARGQADVVSFGLSFETSEGAPVAVRGAGRTCESRQPDIFIDAMLDRAFLSSPCNKGYRRHLLIDQGIRFPPLRAYEDSLFSRHVALHAQHVTYIPDILYRAVTRSGSTTRNLSIRNFQIAADLIERERQLFDHAVDPAIFGAHVVRFFAHLLILAAFRIDDPADRAGCRALADAAGFADYAAQRAVRRHLPLRSRLQLHLAMHPGLLRLAALAARRLNIRLY